MASKLFVFFIDDDSRESASVFYSTYLLLTAKNSATPFKEKFFQDMNKSGYLYANIEEFIQNAESAGYEVQEFRDDTLEMVEEIIPDEDEDEDDD